MPIHESHSHIAGDLVKKDMLHLEAIYRSISKLIQFIPTTVLLPCALYAFITPSDDLREVQLISLG